VQLCAQALCLEEMLAVGVPCGALFYNKVRRREEVSFDPSLRERTLLAALRFHEIVASGRTPIVYRAPKCRSCSLLSVCMPPPRRRQRSVRYYLAGAISGEPD
jgi:CRISPR-associated exonuclease Cas4